MHRVHLNIFASVLTLLALVLTRPAIVVGRTITEADSQNASQVTTSQSAASRSDVVQLNVTSSAASSNAVSTSSTTTSSSSSSSSSTNSNDSIQRTGSITTPSSVQAGGSSSSTTTPEPDFLNSLDASVLNLNYTFEKQLRIEAIKQDILNRLGMTRVPDVSRINMTVQERRQILRLYRKSVEELHGKKESSLLFDDDQFYANQFHSFTEYGKHTTY